ncbi:MAG: alpha/beta fold hydrolase [Actinomycetota bacterium]
MHCEVNGTRLWFDVDGPGLVPDGQKTREPPTIVLVHGRPGSDDHSYFKPDFAHLPLEGQVVYLDLRGHGRSAWGDPADWSSAVCADDLRALIEGLGDLIRVLEQADPAKKAELYESLGLNLVYHPIDRRVAVEADLSMCRVRVGGPIGMNCHPDWRLQTWQSEPGACQRGRQLGSREERGAWRG